MSDTPTLRALIEEYWRIDCCSPHDPWCDDPSYGNTDHYDGHPSAKRELLTRIFAIVLSPAEGRDLRQRTEQDDDLDLPGSAAKG